MTVAVSVEVVPGRLLAAVRRRVRLGEIATAWRPAMDQVWAFLKSRPELRTDGHNILLYHHPASMDRPLDVEFGVEIVAPFEPSGEVSLAQTPAGRVAAAVHIGPYQHLGDAHRAIHAWAAANQAKFAGQSWEIYGDWTDDPTKLETRIEYLLA